MRLSCGDSTFPKLTHPTALEVIADLAIPAVDLCIFHGSSHLAPDTVLTDPVGMAAEVKSHLRSVGLTVADVFAILGPDFETRAVNHPDATERAESRRWFEGILDFARAVQTPGITITPGIPWPNETAEKSMWRSADELNWRSEQAASWGLELSVEPHYQSIVETPEATLRLLDLAPSLTLTLDYAHYVCQGVPEQEVDILLPRTRHLHARQGAIGKMQATHVDGIIDFPRIITALEQLGYAGYFSLEYQWDAWMDCKHADCISETALLRDVFRTTLGLQPLDSPASGHPA